DAVSQLGVDVLLVGQEDAIEPLLPDGRAPGIDVEHAGEVVAMDEDPAAAARRKKDSSLVRCAQAVREGRAQAMVGAGNTGATMCASERSPGSRRCRASTATSRAVTSCTERSTSS